jgi:hypothetical protein
MLLVCENTMVSVVGLDNKDVANGLRFNGPSLSLAIRRS